MGLREAGFPRVVVKTWKRFPRASNPSNIIYLHVLIWFIQPLLKLYICVFLCSIFRSRRFWVSLCARRFWLLGLKVLKKIICFIFKLSMWGFDDNTSDRSSGLLWNCETVSKLLAFLTHHSVFIFSSATRYIKLYKIISY